MPEKCDIRSRLAAAAAAAIGSGLCGLAAGDIAMSGGAEGASTCTTGSGDSGRERGGGAASGGLASPMRPAAGGLAGLARGVDFLG